MRFIAAPQVGLRICVKKLTILMMAIFTYGTVHAATWYSSTAVTDPNNRLNWWSNNNNTGTNPANFTGVGDIFIVQSSQTMTAAWNVTGAGSEIRINNAGSLTVTVGNLTCINITINSGGALNLATARQISLTGAFTYNTGGAFTPATNTSIVNFGTGSSIAGTGTATFTRITVNTGAATNIVPLTAPAVTIANTGTLTLTQGIFKIGAGKTLNMGTTGGSNIAVAANGNFANASDGSGLNTDADGGTINVGATGGTTLAVSGTGSPVFYDISSTNTGDYILNITSTGSPRINGTLSIKHSSFLCQTGGTQYPKWGPNSTLSVNFLGSTYTPGTASHREWMPMASGTIGTTAGYPNNVTLMNLGTGGVDGGGLNNSAAAWSINGTLSIGDGTTSAIASLGGMTAFTCQNIIIDNGSTLKHNLETLTVKGNWTQQGTTTGIFTVVSGTVPITFGGNTAQSINCTGSATSITTINSITINNAGAGINKYVKLNCPVTLASTGTLTLTSGVLQTDATNILTITNTTVNGLGGGIDGGSSTSYIEGPVKWTLLDAGTNVYAFPVGTSTAYLPFTLSSTNTTNGNIATVRAFSASTGGSGFNGINISSTEYWSLSTSAGLVTTGSKVSLFTPPTLNSVYDIIAKSSSQGGSYTTLAGTVGATGITNSNDIGVTSPWFFTLATNPAITTGSVTGSPFCAGATGISVPFTYVASAGFPSGGSCTFTAQLSDASGSFTSAVNLQSVVSNASGSQSISATIPSATLSGSSYRIRVVSNTPSINGSDNGSNLTVNALPSITGSASVCMSGTLTLTGSGTPAVTNTWLSSATGVATIAGTNSTTGTVTPVTPGGSTITYTDINGCSNTKAITVSAAATITGSLAVCMGGSLSLTGSGTPATSSTWMSSATGIATVSGTNSTTGTVTPVAAGSTNITYTDINGCTDTKSITVNVLPTISGSSAVCMGGTLLPAGSGTPATTNTWVSSAPGVATISGVNSATGIITPVSAGSTTITYTNINGCSNTKSITVNDLPTISGSAAACVSSTLTLTGSGTPATSSTWASSATGIATVSGTNSTTGTVTPVSAGGTTITYTDINGCSNTKAITVNAAATITGSSSVCMGGSLVLTGSGTPAASNTWVSSATGVATISGTNSTTGTVTPVSAGPSTISYTDINNCVGTKSITVYALPTVSITGSSSICTGTTTTLSPTSGGTWASNNTLVATVTNGGIVTAVGAGSTTFTFTNSISSCSQTTGSVTVNTAPLATTSAATSVSTTTTTLNGTVNANTISTNNYFNWATDAYYIANASTYNNLNVAASPATSTGAGNTTISLALTGLTPNTKYHFQAKGNNGTCSAVGNDANFTTLPNAPTVGTATVITPLGFTANWTAPAITGSETYTYTVEASTDATFATVNATGSAIASGTTSYTFSTLSPGTTYYFRAKTVNVTGSSVWSTVSASVLTTTYGTYYNRTGGTLDAGLVASWTTDPLGGAGSSPANFTSGDKFIVRASSFMNVATTWSVSGGPTTEVRILGQLTQQTGFTLAGTFTNNGTFNNGNQTLTLGTNGSIGGSTATTFNNITINTTSASDIVTLTKSGISLQDGATLNINQGVFNVGASNVINMSNGGGMTITTTANGNFATTGTNGADGGTLNIAISNGNKLIVNGPAKFYNLYSTADGNWRLDLQNNATRINGTLRIPQGSNSNQFQVLTYSPIWGPASTFYWDKNGQQYNIGLDWVQMASGTIGVTPGYPNNVTFMNMGTSAGNGCGYAPSGTWSMNGVFSLGNGTASCIATFQYMTAFTCGGIVIDNGSTLKHQAATVTVKGNWTQQGTTTGIFSVVSGTTPIIFGGSGTSVSPQTINCSGSSSSITTLNSISLTNGTYVKLNCPVTLATQLTLTSGILETSSTNVLSITNTATTGITGTGSSVNFINGPVKWTLANSTTNKYTFPIGKSTQYLPFDITPANAQANNVITVEAFNVDCTGTADNTTVFGLSNTEYWSLSSSLSFTAVSSIVSVGRSTGVTGYDVIAKSTSAAGTYSSIAGSSGTVGNAAGLINSSSISASSPWFFVLGQGLLSINLISVTYPQCSGGTGSITVAGSAGTPPYNYNINGGAYQSSGTFSGLSAGVYTVGVKDNTNATAYLEVEIDVLVITEDTGYCAGGSVQLQATGITPYSYAWTPTTGLSSSTIANPVATPASTTTYTLTTTVVDSVTNLITNNGFESGNSGFTSGFILHTCAAYFSSWNPAPAAPCNTYGQFHNGIYMVTSNPQNLCTNLSSFGPRTGSNMMVIDGPNSGTYTTSPYPVWSQALTGLTANTDYIFSYWIRRGNNDDPTNGNPSLRTKINGTNLTATTFANPFVVTTAYSAAWTQITYLWNSGASTTASIEIFDETVADVANDFAIDDITFYGTCKPSKQVTVTVNSTPTLTAASQPVQACSGNGAVINLTGLTAGTFTVNYKINGVAQTPVTGVVSVAGSASFTTPALTAASNGLTLEVTSLKNTLGNSGCTQTFTGKTMSLNVNTNITWLGIGTDWNTSTNWCGGIPITTSNVVIPSGLTNYPILSTGAMGTCNNLTIQSGAGSPSVTVTGNTIQVYGTISNSGKFDLTAGTLELKGASGAQSISGPNFYLNTIQNLKISNSSLANPRVSVTGSATDTLKITGAISFGNVNNAVLDAGNLITLISTASATARVADVTNAGANSGNTITNKVVVERYLPMLTSYSGRRWRLLGVPLKTTNAPTIRAAWQEAATPTSSTTNINTTTNPHPGYGTHITNGVGNINNGNGFDAGSTSNPSIYKMEPGTGLWSPPTATNDPITNYKAYMLFSRGDRSIVVSSAYINTTGGTTLRMKGNLNVGNDTVAIINGMQVLTNPYASAISFNNVKYKTVTPGTTTGTTYYLWDPKLLGSKNVGGFVTFSSTGSNTYNYVPYTTYPGGSAGMSSFGNTGIIESGGAFMIQNSGGAGNFIFYETNKVSTSSTVGIASRPIAQNRPLAKIAEFYTNLFYRDAMDSAILADGVATTFSEDYHNEVDEQDATKLQTFQTKEKLSLLRDNKVLAIERRQNILVTDTIHLQINKLDFNYRYQFQFYGNQFAPDLEAFLIDKYLNEVYPVKTEGVTKHNFETGSDQNSLMTDRFKVVFKLREMGGPLPVKFIDVRAGVKPDRSINIEWNIGEEISIKNYIIERSLDGVHFTEAGTIPATGKIEYSWTDGQANGVQYYRIIAVDEQGEKVYSKIVSLNLTGIAGITIYPNPVKDHKLNIRMNDLPIGKYQLSVWNALGQLVEIKDFNLSNNDRLRSFDLNKNLAKGLYQIEIKNNNLKYTKDLIIE